MSMVRGPGAGSKQGIGETDTHKQVQVEVRRHIPAGSEMSEAMSGSDNSVTTVPDEAGKVMPRRLLRRKEVSARTGLGRSSIYDKMQKGSFPQPVRLGERSVAWIESEINAWIDERIAERQAWDGTAQ